MKVRTAATVGLAAVVSACGHVAGPGTEPRARLPDAATVICDEEGTRVETPAVRPKPNGVLLVVDNRTSEDLGISYRQGSGGRWGERRPGDH